MRQFLKGLVIAGLLGIMIAMTTGWALAGGVLKIARQQDSTTLDPIMTIQNADIWVMNNMNSLLVRVSRDGTTIEPDLAESWTISPDGKVYTMNLRTNLKFGDGSPLKASDARYSLLRLRDKEGSVMAGMFTDIDTIDTPDDRTLVINLKQRSAPFLAALAMFSAAVLPEQALKERGEDFGSNPAGAGAFNLKEWKRGQYISLVKNPYFWEADRVKLDGVEWSYIPNDNTRILKLQTAEVDAAIFIPFNRAQELDRNKDINVHMDPSSRMDHMLVNHSHKPLDDLRVRQAIYYALNRQAIVDVVTFEYGKVANSFIPAGAMHYNPDNFDYPYDPAKAKKLLADAAVKGLTLDLLVTAGDSVHDQIAVMVKDQLGKAGIDVNIVKQEEGQQWESTVAGEYDISVNYWTNDVIDPDQKSSFCVFGDAENLSYYTRYRNPKVTALVEKGRTELDSAKRRQIYYDIQRMAKEDVHWIDLYYSPFRNASRTNVVNYFQNPMGRFMLEDTYMK
ncbi:ABC transporter, substrate-binding protein (cluster 5, nickel/peptides/opines) [Olavius sp. associated proteobacterium Delta 1]|nr:ABC transporter, substrate-binding protein (cluster 5, nickel/peptides/opines) [Olavius sp. associated proteobacterium Delta 1]